MAFKAVEGEGGTGRGELCADQVGAKEGRFFCCVLLRVCAGLYLDSLPVLTFDCWFAKEEGV